MKDKNRIQQSSLAAKLRCEAALHPLLRPADAVKFVYQSEYGGSHLLTSEGEKPSFAAVADGIGAERAEKGLVLSEKCVFQMIGGGHARLDLRSPLSDGTAAGLFYLSAEEDAGARGEAARRVRLECRLSTLRAVTERGGMPFDITALDAYLRGWLGTTRSPLFAAPSPVGHSDAYRCAYSPSYRVIRAEWTRLAGALTEIDRLLSGGRRVVIALDGRAGSGKSYLAARIAALYRPFCGSAVISADSFFLPPAKRTPERLAACGGNFDYERFTEQVAEPLAAGREVVYDIFDCRVGGCTSRVTLPRVQLVIVEGTYCLHRAAGRYADLALRVTAPDEIRLDRLRRRESGASMRRFISEWIPMEEKYFASDPFSRFPTVTVRN